MDTPSDSDRARDQNDRARDQTYDKPFERKRGYQYARNYPDPITGDPLQVHPPKVPSDFDSDDDFWAHVDAVSRWNSGLPPPRPMPEPGAAAGLPPVAPLPKRASCFKPTKSRHLGMPLTESEYELLATLARAHSVRPGTMARMLVVRSVLAAADEGDEAGSGDEVESGE